MKNRSIPTIVYNICWVIGFIIVLIIFNRMDDNVHDNVRSTFNATYLSILPIMHFFLGAYLAIAFVNILKFKFKLTFMLSLVIPLTIAILFIDQIYPLMNHTYLPINNDIELMITALGIAVFVSLFEFRAVK